MKNILFIHHGSLNGGAPLSMNYTMNALKPFGYNFTVGLVYYKAETIEYFKKNGNNVLDLSWIKTQTIWSAFDKPIYNRRSFIDYINATATKKKNTERLKTLLREQNFDLIHLNSVVLNPIADILTEQNIPFVWHIREAAPQKNRGFRFNKIVKLMKSSNQLIFLSDAEKQSWLGQSNHGIVVNNFVDFNTFNSDNCDLIKTREKYNVKSNDFILLFLGGFKEHKGPDILIEALNLLVNNKDLKNIKCIMPDTMTNNNNNSTPGILKKVYRTYKKTLQTKGKDYDFKLRMNNLIKERRLDNNCILLPFNPYTQELFAISNVVIFPAKVPHFARPIIEAGAMKLPVIASNLPILNELVINNETGLLSELNAESVALNIKKLYDNKNLCVEMGVKAKVIAAEKYNADKQIKLIKRLYESVLIN